MKLVDIVGLHVEATTGTPLLVLREQDEPHRVLPIFIGESEAASIAVALSGQQPPRPLSHDLMAALVDSVGASVELVEVTALHDGAFVAQLALSGPAGDHRVDSRPSDAIALAVRVGAPVFVAEAVLHDAGGIIAEPGDPEDEPAVDAEAIDEEVAAFRSLLDDVDLGELTSGHQTGEPHAAGGDGEPHAAGGDGEPHAAGGDGAAGDGSSDGDGDAGRGAAGDGAGGDGEAGPGGGEGPPARPR